MSIKKINEELESFIINELSTDTKQWAKDEREARYLAAQATADREKEKLDKTKRRLGVSKSEISTKDISNLVLTIGTDDSNIETKETDDSYIIVITDAEVEDGELTKSAEEKLKQLLDEMTKKYGCEYTYKVNGTKVEIIYEKRTIKGEDVLSELGINIDDVENGFIDWDACGVTRDVERSFGELYFYSDKIDKYTKEQLKVIWDKLDKEFHEHVSEKAYSIEILFDDLPCYSFLVGTIREKVTKKEADEFKKEYNRILKDFKNRYPKVAREIVKSFNINPEQDIYYNIVIYDEFDDGPLAPAVGSYDNKKEALAKFKTLKTEEDCIKYANTVDRSFDVDNVMAIRYEEVVNGKSINAKMKFFDNWFKKRWNEWIKEQK